MLYINGMFNKFCKILPMFWNQVCFRKYFHSSSVLEEELFWPSHNTCSALLLLPSPPCCWKAFKVVFWFYSPSGPNFGGIRDLLGRGKHHQHHLCGQAHPCATLTCSMGTSGQGETSIQTIISCFSTIDVRKID